MSQKTRVQYTCQNCGWMSSGWQGRCSQCSAWNSLIEQEVFNEKTEQRPSLSSGGEPLPFSKISSKEPERFTSGLLEFDRVLGGGLVPGAFILVGGSPGIGKSTLLLQASGHLAQQKKKALYVSAEESARQTALRAARLKIDSSNLLFFSESALDSILTHCEKTKPHVLVIDSIQTVFLNALSSAPGTVSQVRESATRLMTVAKSQNITVFAVGHVTKEGGLAGPRVLEHLVDTVLSFEGDNHYQFRILRSHKNRFGPTNETAVFEMLEDGIKEVLNPSEFFLRETSEDRLGSSVFVGLEGSRPILCEIQSLTIPSYLAIPRRTSLGLDLNRIHMIAAVLDKYMKADLGKRDLFVNLVGGLKITEPASDFAVALSILSSRYKTPCPRQSCFFGEVGLTGELRACRFPRERVKEADKLGFQNIYVPKRVKDSLKNLKIKIQIHFKEHLEEMEVFKR